MKKRRLGWTLRINSSGQEEIRETSMEGARELGSDELLLQDTNCSFVWDEKSQLYFHSSSGFYHDPVAGWYYSSRDGCYYKFENGSYVLLQSNEHDEECKADSDNPVNGEPCRQVCNISSEGHSSFEANELELDASKCTRSEVDGLALEQTEGSINEHENPPTSLWLEDTLIDLFLSGYSNSEVVANNDCMSPTLSTINEANNFLSSSDGYVDTQRIEGELLQNENHAILNSSEGVLNGAGYDDTQMMDGEWFQDVNQTILNPRESVLDGGVSTEEDNWKAQYGQVTDYGEETIPKLSVVDIWDWSTVSESRTGGKGTVTRLVGRLVRKSAKLHPSVSSNGALLKTAPICEVHLDLVRVATGKIYKLHSPSKKYLASMTTFDSSNPTKDWGFPNLLERPNDLANNETRSASSHAVSTSVDNLSAAKTCSSQNQYRDRASERRILHGGFGIGPGQKNSACDHGDPTSSPPSGCSESTAAEALNSSFGAGSYARKILRSMGWKEGEGLGSSTKGMVEPLQAVGNIGNAGLGWPQGIRKTQH